MKLRVSAVY